MSDIWLFSLPGVAAGQSSSQGTSEIYQHSLITVGIVFLDWILPEIIELLSRTWESIFFKKVFSL